MRNAEINKIKENNKQIEKLIQKYIEKYKQKGNTLENNEQAKKILKYKLGLCLEIYKAEFQGNKCVGRQKINFIKQKGVYPDCYGNEDGLTLTTEKNKWLEETAPKIIYGIEEYLPNNKYVGSMYDMYNYISYLVNENKTDLDWANDAIPHEAMHIFGVIGGNDFLTEGIAEELAREISEKYNINMAPVSHSVEAEFVRKKELIVGRKAVIKSGLMKNKNKDNPEFAEITTKEVTEKFNKVFGNGSLEKYVEELSKLQAELNQNLKLREKVQSKIKEIMQPIDKYIEGKEIDYNDENYDYTNILKYQEEMIIYLKEIVFENDITQQKENTQIKEKDEETMEKPCIDNQYLEQKFKESAEEIINGNSNADLSFFLEGLCGIDVSQIDMENLSQENFKRLTFDEKTKFSPEQIEKFHPKEVIKEGKKFSESMKKLQEKGIDGRGTKIAIIDSCFDSKVEEFEDRVIQQLVFEKKDGDDFISHREYREKDGDGFHGKTTASLAVGKECGVAPKAEVYLFGIAEGTPWAEAKEAILKYIINNDINVDIISMSADTEDSKQTQKMLEKLEEKGCSFLNSSGFWKNFSWGRLNEGGTEVVQDEFMKTISNTPYEENSIGGKVIKNLPNTVLIPCTGRTSLQVGKEKIYKYNGSVCGASFAIPQVSALFAIARQIDPTINFNEFVEIVKNPERLNSEGMMYVEPEEVIEKAIENRKIKEEKFTEDSRKEKSTQDLGKETLVEQTNTELKKEIEYEIENQEQEIIKETAQIE